MCFKGFGALSWWKGGSCYCMVFYMKHFLMSVVDRCSGDGEGMDTFQPCEVASSPLIVNGHWSGERADKAAGICLRPLSQGDNCCRGDEGVCSISERNQWIVNKIILEIAEDFCLTIDNIAISKLAFAVWFKEDLCLNKFLSYPKT